MSQDRTFMFGSRSGKRQDVLSNDVHGSIDFNLNLMNHTNALPLAIFPAVRSPSPTLSLTQNINTVTTTTLIPTTLDQLLSTLPPAPVVGEAEASVASDELVSTVSSALVVDAVDSTTLASALCVALEDSITVEIVAPLASPTSVSDDELSTPMTCVDVDVDIGVDIGVTVVESELLGIGVVAAISELTTGVELLKTGTEQIA
ncbi:hypothetical protein J4E91_010588 [Alternaria rosae]|nr:hypothetical protein J4E91_010588 [Alternaria rosae]